MVPVLKDCGVVPGGWRTVIMGLQPCRPASRPAGLFQPSIRYVGDYQSVPPPNSMYTMGPMNGTKLMAAHRIFCVVDKSVRPAILIQHSTTASGCNTIATAISNISFTNGSLHPSLVHGARTGSATPARSLAQSRTPSFPGACTCRGSLDPARSCSILHATANAHFPVPPAVIPCRHLAFGML